MTKSEKGSEKESVREEKEETPREKRRRDVLYGKGGRVYVLVVVVDYPVLIYFGINLFTGV